jgi:hypothetical protein
MKTAKTKGGTETAKEGEGQQGETDDDVNGTNYIIIT